jgi:hypothetical protein
MLRGPDVMPEVNPRRFSIAALLLGVTLCIVHYVFASLFGLVAVGAVLGAEAYVIGSLLLRLRSELPFYILSIVVTVVLSWLLSIVTRRLGYVEIHSAAPFLPGVLLLALYPESTRSWITPIASIVLCGLVVLRVFPFGNGGSSSGEMRVTKGLICKEHMVELNYREDEGAFRGTERYVAEEGHWKERDVGRVMSRDRVKQMLGDDWIERSVAEEDADDLIVYSRTISMETTRPSLLARLAEFKPSRSWCPARYSVSIPRYAVLEHNLVGELKDHVLDDGSPGRRLLSAEVASHDGVIRLRYPPSFFQTAALSWLVSPVLWRPGMWMLSLFGVFFLYLIGVAADVIKDDRLKPIVQKLMSRTKTK